MSQNLIRPLDSLTREQEGTILRGLLGMILKKRNANIDLLEICKKKCVAFLTEYNVGVTQDDSAGVFVIHVAKRDDDEKRLIANP